MTAEPPDPATAGPRGSGPLSGPEDEALLGGEPGAAWAVKGDVRVAFSFTITGAGRITVIDLIGDPAALPGLKVELAR
jgi:hypothetical protein